MLFISHVTGHICANLTSANFHFQISKNCNTQLSSVQSLSHVQLFETPWSAARQASLSITNSQSLLKLIAIESVMPSNHLILCHPILLPPWIFPSIRVFSNESVFASGGQSIGVSASASILPVHIQDLFLWDGLVGSPCSPRDSQESSPTPHRTCLRREGETYRWRYIFGHSIHGI